LYLSLEDIFCVPRFEIVVPVLWQDHPNWEIRGSSVYFQKVKDLAPCKEIPSLQLINQTLGYARELERIV
jgi:26S proteasome regulatory subunit N12